jgi:hypothetical protein
MVPVKAGHSLWLDFNANADKRHDVAVVVSTQGVNALTTMKTREPKLVQYRAGNLCPIHKVPFVGDRHCDECKYEWSPQNYLATTGTPRGYFWLDGFRTTEGVTRQWVFTEDVLRSVAAAVLGEERVHAIGLAFFLSKEPKPIPAPISRPEFAAHAGDYLEREAMSTARVFGQAKKGLSFPRGEVLQRSKLEIAAGAMIDQLVHADPRPLVYWQDEPVGIIVINYTDEQTALDVLARGSSAEAEGPLAALDVPVGHSSNHGS